MPINLRLPNINGVNEKEQISQLKSYLYQLVTELEFVFNTSGASSDSVVVLPKAQQGSKSTDSGNMSATAMFSVLKPLIIKSADIVDAYYDKLTKKFDGDYVASSDFGTYTETTQQTIEANSYAIEQTFSNVQTIDTNLNNKVSSINQNIEDTAKGLSESLKDATSDLSDEISEVSKDLGNKITALAESVEAVLTVNAYTRSGVLYYDNDSLPVYGFEVGQTNTVNGVETFKKFARFIADRLSFYDQNDMEVAYISDYKLYITSVEILYSLIGGGFILDFSRGFTLKFAGGE